jgi:hypothetical protein
MKSKGILGIIIALSALSIAMTVQGQDVSAFNDKNNEGGFNSHSHTTFCEAGENKCTSNDGRVLNDENTHSNDNFNSNRPEPQQFHSHDKPNNDK